jgi:hypothetical protein
MMVARYQHQRSWLLCPNIQADLPPWPFCPWEFRTLNHLDFEFVSDFEFRISDLAARLSAVLFRSSRFVVLLWLCCCLE